MLTPVDVQNKTFKGGIGYDKKEVENFMREVASDYESLYRSNVELKDKVTTLNESLQHYRTIEDSMQKALTLSEKTAEETINAANDKGRQVTTEAEKKAESILEDAKKELADTKNEIYKLQQQYVKFKQQYTKILYTQLKGLGEEIPNIDLGEDFKADSTYEESTMNDGLNGLGAGGGYTGSSSLDDRFERTNQESAFGNMGTLNMDPFADAMNGGGRFSKKSSKTYSSNSKKKTVNATANTVDSHEDKKSAEPVKNITTSAESKTEQAMSSAVSADSDLASTIGAAVSVEPKVEERLSGEDKVIRFESSKPNEEKIVSGEVEEAINKSTMLDNSDDDSEGFNFIQDVESIQRNSESFKVKAEPVKESVVFSEKKVEPTLKFVAEKTESAAVSDSANEAIIGEVEDRVNESTMLDSQDNYAEGFDFLDNGVKDTITSNLDTAGLDEDTYVGEVEDRVNESTMLESEDDASEGFNFLVGNEEEEDDIPTIFPNLHTINVTAPATDTWKGAIEEETEEEEEEIRFV